MGLLRYLTTLLFGGREIPPRSPSILAEWMASPSRVVRQATDPMTKYCLENLGQPVWVHDRRRDKSGQSYRSHTRGNGEAYLLSGLVVCAHCGCKMHGSTLMRSGREYPKYVCSTYCRSGKHNPHGCGCHGVHQNQLVDVLVRKLQEGVLSGDNLERLRKALRRQLGGRKTSAKETNSLRRRLVDLDREIDRAADNFLRAPSEVLDLIGQKLTALKRQRETALDELRRVEGAERTQDTEAQIEAAVAHSRRYRSHPTAMTADCSARNKARRTAAAPDRGGV